MKKTVKYLAAGIIIFLLTPVKSVAQNSFWGRLKPSISYGSIDGREYETLLRVRDYDGSAVGIGLKYTFSNSKWFLQFSHQKANIFAEDLHQDVGVSNTLVDFGKSIQVFPRGHFSPQIGMAIFQFPAYTSTGSSREDVTHSWDGKKSGALNLKVGMDYTHELRKGLYVGFDFSLYYLFDDTAEGSTNYSLFLEFDLF